MFLIGVESQEHRLPPRFPGTLRERGGPVARVLGEVDPGNAEDRLDWKKKLPKLTPMTVSKWSQKLPKLT